MPFFQKKIYPPGFLLGGYKIVQSIGEGRFGICYLVDSETKRYILKVIKPNAIKKSGHKLIFEERILSSIDNPAIPKIIDVIKADGVHGYILEYKSGRTLEEMIFDDGHVFSQGEIYKVVIKLIEIIKYLHKINIVHRDIRVPNVVINGEEVYLIDFGLARIVDNDKYVTAIDFSSLGHLLIHLYYSSFDGTSKKSGPWYEELELTEKETIFLKKLLGLEQEYKSIVDVEYDFEKIFRNEEIASK